MNAIRNPMPTHTISLLIFGTCLLLAGAKDASAHKIDFRPYVVQHQYVYGQTRVFPVWLRRNREFQRWYLQSCYRSTRGSSWKRLYDDYRFEKRHRLRNTRFHGKDYRDRGYRACQRKPKKRRH